jgi:hypothetical protein
LIREIKEMGMGHIVVESSLLERLTGLVEPVEFRDAEGKVIGHYAPTLPAEVAERYAAAAKLFDLKEAEHRLRTEKGRRTTAEVLARLKEQE